MIRYGTRSGNAQDRRRLPAKCLTAGGFTFRCSLCTPGVEHLGLRRIVAKIGLANEPSRKLFRSLGFVHESTAEIFQEETLALAVPANGALPAACQALETVVRTAAAPDHVRADP